MKRMWVLPAAIALSFAVLMSPDFAAPGRRALLARASVGLVLVVALAAIVVFWVTTIAELLRRGPGAQREWWLAALAIVVLLGPLGAAAYRLARPTFDRSMDRDFDPR